MTLRTISAGYFHSMVLDREGNVWSVGQNKDGQLGLGDFNNRETPQCVPNKKFQNLICSSNFSLLIGEDGKIYGCGSNEYGQLGMEDVEMVNIPTIIPKLPNGKSLATNRKSSMILDEEGNVWVSGNNEKGELGSGHSIMIKTFQKLSHFTTPIIQIELGEEMSLLLDEEGIVWASGSCEFLTYVKKFPTKIQNLPKIIHISYTYLEILFLDENRNVYEFCKGLNSPRIVSIPSTVLDIYAGRSYCLLIDVDGFVWCRGKSNRGQLGLGDLRERKIFEKNESLFSILHASAGYEHSIFVDENGSVWGTGNNFTSQLGKPPRVQKLLIPEIISGLPPVDYFVQKNIKKSARK